MTEWIGTTAPERKGVFQFEGKNWDGEVDGENGNYDYLMGARR